MKPATATTHETHCLAHADHFVAVRGRKPADRIRETFPRIEEAEARRSSSSHRIAAGLR